MTVCCEYCRNPAGAKPRIPLCKSTCFTAAEKIKQRIPYKPFRSTKGASKARRDHINAEIRTMRALLPVSEDEKERLSYLHTMSVACSYVRKSLFCQELCKDVEETSFLPYEDFLQALPGFIVAVSSEGKLIYISENVTDYLGYSMVDLFQGNGFYHMIESADVEIAKAHLQSNSSPETDPSFICRMHTSRSFRLRHGSSCAVLVRGSFQAVRGTPPSSSSSGAVFVALCTPTVNRLQHSETHSYVQRFQSQHQPDMTFTDAPDSIFYHLGFSTEEMTGRSWYSLLHPDDLSFASAKHKLLLKGDEGRCHVEIVVRLQCKDLSWTRVYIRALLDSAKQSVTCINDIISETEATLLCQQIACQSEQGAGVNEYQCNIPAPSANQSHKERPAKSLKRQLDNDILVEEPSNKASRISEPSICTYYVSLKCLPCVNSSSAVLCYTPSTPPYSPQSDCSSFLQEDSRSPSFSNTHFFGDTYGFAEGLLPLTRSSPSFYPDELSVVSNHAVASEPLPEIVDSAFSLGSFSGSQVIAEELSPSCYDFSSCTNDVHLVPDCMTMEHMSGGVADCSFHLDSLSTPENLQGNLDFYMPDQSSAEASLVPGSLMVPVASPTAQNSFQFSEKEKTEISILACQISSLATSFDAYQSIDQVLNIPGDFTNVQEPQGDQQQLCSWTDSVMLERESVLNDRVFDSVLKDLATVSAKESNRCSPSASCADPELTPTSAVSYGMESNQLLLDTNTVEPADLLIMPLEDDLSLDEFSTVHPAFDSIMMSSACDGYSNELHQLNEYLHHRLQQDGSVEESMY